MIYAVVALNIAWAIFYAIMSPRVISSQEDTRRTVWFCGLACGFTIAQAYWMLICFVF